MQDIRPNVQCLLIKDNQILLGKRRGGKDKAAGTFGVPAGHIEEGESILECAKRELKEETTLDTNPENLEVFCLTEETQAENGHHYLNIGVLVEDWSGEVKTGEPDKCTGWKWYTLSNLPSPLFKPSKEVIDCYENNRSFYIEI